MHLREVVATDLPIFHAHRLDPDARRMVAFTRAETVTREGFDAHWAKLLRDPTVTLRTIEVDGQVAGYLVGFVRGTEAEVGYWLGREHWGSGLATRALRAFLEVERRRPLHARVVSDHAASLRVLEKCGFAVARRERTFANERGAEVEEVVLVRA